MKIVLLDAKTLGDDIVLDMFDEFGEVEIYNSTAADEVENRIQDADVIVVNKIKLNEGNLRRVRNLKLICITATGFDNVDTEYCRKHNIAVCNVKGYSTDSVAQVTLALALSLCTHIREYTGYVTDGRYTKSGVQNYLKPTFHEISGMTWGVVGLGGIGRRVAEIARAMGCRVLAFKQSPDSEFECDDIDTLCKSCDIISVHLPLNEQTREIVNADRFAEMKDGVIFINAARGAVIDEYAAVQAVKSGKLGGLGIDVYSVEPMPENHPYNEIMHMDNVLLTPHMAWGAYEARIRCMNEIAENIRAFLRGEERNRV